MRSVPLVLALATLSSGTLAAQDGAGVRDGPDVEANDFATEGEESPELRALRLAELEMFGRSQPLVEAGTGPFLHIGQPPPVMRSDTSPVGARPAEGRGDLRWLEGLALPDIPVRWDERVIRYLEFYKDDPRGRNIMGAWLQRAQRWAPIVRRRLAEAGLPEDLVYVAMIESGFDPRARSRANAVGMWQFVRNTGAEYGLRIDHWIDERMDPEAATGAGARYLAQLYRRFGSWELAFAAYNMGYGALLRALRKYNTNDYWVLSELEAGLPFETTFYVAKVMACAIVGRNPERFGYEDVGAAEPVRFDRVEVPGGAALSRVARAAGTDADTLAALNPKFRRNRTPPGAPTSVRIPHGRADAFARTWTRMEPRRPAHRPYVVRFGETLSEIATRHRISAAQLRSLNELADDAGVGVGFELLVPAVEPRATDDDDAEPVVATVPARTFRYPDRRRIFYRIVDGDTAHEIARFFDVPVDDLRRWNHVEPSATLQPGMLLQLFVPRDADLSRAVVLSEDAVRVLVVGTEEFFDYHEAQRGRVRFRYTVRPGDTLTRIGQRFDLSVGSLARINQFSRNTELVVGQEIIVYTARERAPQAERRAADERVAAAANAAGATVASSPPVADDGDGEDEAADAAVEVPGSEPVGDPADEDADVRGGG